MEKIAFLLLLVVCDMVSGIFINCVINKEPFESAKLKKGLIEKGIELLIIFTIQVGEKTGYAGSIAATGAEALTIGAFVLQEVTSVYENFKKLH